jgi:hypothetical protein
MADPYEYSHPKDKPPGNAPYDPSVGDPDMLPGCRWRIGFYTKGKAWKTGKELPKLSQTSDMKGTRVLSAGEETPGWELEVTEYKDYFK